MDTSEYIKLIEIRKRAFIAGVLQSTDDDWIKGFAFANNKLMKSDMRLKGDWLDHLHGNKWSFRIKLKKVILGTICAFFQFKAHYQGSE